MQDTAGEAGTYSSVAFFLWTPTHWRASVDRPARTYIHQLCVDMGCSFEDLSWAIDDRDGWRERERVKEIRFVSATWWWWWLSFDPFLWKVSATEQLLYTFLFILSCILLNIRTSLDSVPSRFRGETSISILCSILPSKFLCFFKFSSPNSRLDRASTCEIVFPFTHNMSKSNAISLIVSV